MQDNRPTIKIHGPPTSLGVLLGCIFVVLKLTGNIDWSWFWVTLPFWAGFALALGIVLGAALIAGVVWIVAHALNRILINRARKKRNLNRY